MRAATSENHPLKKLIKDFGPEGCEDDHWMEDEDQVLAALSRRSHYMLGGLEGNALIDQCGNYLSHVGCEIGFLSVHFLKDLK